MTKLCKVMWLLCTVLGACTGVQPRPAVSTLGCLQAVRAQLPNDLSDKQLHCLLSAHITIQCSVTEAYLGGLAKEMRDLFGAGDADWKDWDADRAGMRCGKTSDPASLEACCAAQGH